MPIPKYLVVTKTASFHRVAAIVDWRLQRARKEAMMTKTVVAALVISGSLCASAGAQQKGVVIEPVVQTDKTISGQGISLPSGTAEVSVTVFDIQPGATLPVHRHKYPRYGYVLSGELDVTNEETGKTLHFVAGDFIVESVNQWHKGGNPGSVPLKLLVIDQGPKNVPNTELQK